MSNLSYNALTVLLEAIEYIDAVEKLSNEELAHILIEQVWAELAIDTPASAFIGEIAFRLDPTLDKDDPVAA